jgi:hypothetical protein
VDRRAGIDNVAKRKFLILLGHKLRFLIFPTRNQTLYLLHCPWSLIPQICFVFLLVTGNFGKRSNCLLPFHTTRTAQETKRPTILLLRVYSLAEVLNSGYLRRAAGKQGAQRRMEFIEHAGEKGSGSSLVQPFKSCAGGGRFRDAEKTRQNHKLTSFSKSRK